MLCAKCGKEVGNLYCGKCRDEIAGRSQPFKDETLFPLLYWDFKREVYVFGCTVHGCPCNRDGKCLSPSKEFPLHLFHPFDGDNIIKQVCG